MNAPDVAADAQAVRRLTPTEAERLQGVPDGWSLPYGPSLADAPAWHDLRNPPLPVRAVTINEGNDTPQGSVWESDQCGSLATGGGKPGQGYHAVRTEPADPTWIGLDNANRGNDHVREGQPSAEALRAKGTLDQAVCFHADALGRDGEAKTDSPDAEGRMRKRDAGTGIAEGESYNLTTGAPHAVAYDRYSSPPLTAAGFHGNADGRTTRWRRPRSRSRPATTPTASGWAGLPGAPSRAGQGDRQQGRRRGAGGRVLAMAQGGQGWAPNSIATSEDEAHTIDTTRAQAVAFEPRYYNREHDTGGPGTPPSGETLPPLKAQSGQGDGAPHVAFAQNQRDEVRELDQASSLSGPGTHQTTYVAGTAVAAGLACPYDCPPDGPRYAALGDAVTAPVARWIGERLVDVLRERGVIAADGAVDLGADLG
jgi:site-specific DNA-cytosine methylase